jgi:two-component system CheB/CheR fusion protein
MAAFDTHAAPVHVCAITHTPENRTSLDALLRGLADLENLCLVLIGDAEGVALPTDWQATTITDVFQPTGRRVLVGAQNAEAVFEDMANRLGARAFAVRLGQSPVGSAMLGLIEAGGMTLIEGARDDTSQEADLIGPVDLLCQTIIAICRRAANRQARVDPLSTQETREVCDVLRDATGHDFKHYKETTLSRRILRRIHVLHCDTFDDYLTLLKSSADEPRALMRDMLIGVTAFFRDPDAFAALNTKVIEPLLSAENPGIVRLWLAGCSTGPEAYTLAMLVRERLDATGQDREVQIFATDLDERALNVARKGIYPAAMVEHLPAERVARHFTKVGGRYHVNKAVRQMIVFSPHNLIADPPFSKMDLIVCRNVMIYLGAHLQKKLISVFHYALADNGHLFLGSSEAVTGHGDLFRVVDSRARIAQRKDVGARTIRPRQPAGNGSVTWQTHAGGPELNLAAISQRIVLDEFAPPYLIATEDGQITYTSARVGAFLEVPEGQYMNNLIRVVRTGVRTSVRAAWAAALKSRRKSVHEGLTIGTDNDRRRTRIVVQPMPDLGKDAGTYMVVFFDLGQVADTDLLISGNPDSERLFADLEAELFQAREELEHSMQDLEGANEELKSSNEELLSMNEELQAANEELESSKDEIERANAALEDANTDLVNLLRSTQIATIFLDGAGNLRRFTPAAGAFYNITQADIGRPLGHFTHRFSDLPPMPAHDGLETAHETEAVRDDGRTFLRRVTPYATETGPPTGIVVTFIDITAAKQAEERIRRSREQLHIVTENAPVMIAQIDADLRYTFVNSAFAQFWGHRANDLIGQSVATVLGAAAFAQAEPHIKTVLAGETVSYAMDLESEAGPVHLTVNYAPELGADGQVIGFVSALIDVTQGTIAERNLLASEARFRASQQAAPQGFMIFRALRNAAGQIEDFVIDYANDSSLRLSGRAIDEVLGVRLLTAFPGNREEGLFEKYIEIVQSGQPMRIETAYENEGMAGWFEITAVRVDDGVAVLWDNITLRKEQERQIGDHARRLRRILNGVVALVGAVSPDGILTEANQPALDIAHLTREDVIGKPFWEAFWWSHDPDVQAQVKHAVKLAAEGKTSRFDVKIRVARGAFMFIDFQLAPLFDDQGRVVELIPSAIDITERLHVEDAVRRNAEQLTRTLDGLDTMVGLMNADGTISDLNATALEQLDIAKADLLGRSFPDLPWWAALPDLREQVRRLMAMAMTGQQCREDVQFRGPDGALRWLDFTLAPIRGTNGETAALVWSGNDITDRRASEQALADSRERLRIATRAAHLGTFDLNPATGTVIWDARALEILGLPDRQTSLEQFLALLNDDDRNSLRRDIEDGLNPALDRRSQHISYRVKRPDGTMIWVEAHASFSLDSAAKVVGTIQDITDRKRAQERQELLLHELNHRVKNSLATIQAIASHTLRHAENPEAFRTAFGGRLAAIAAAHDILVGNEQSGADLHQLFKSQIGPYASIERGQVVLTGPSVSLGPTVAHALGLVLHELATNASKYGALSTEAGVLEISWTLLDKGGRAYTKINWTERNGPPVTPPTRRGFGSRLIDMTLTHTLDGEVQLQYDPAGFQAQLLIQLVAENDF